MECGDPSDGALVLWNHCIRNKRNERLGGVFMVDDGYREGVGRMNGVRNWDNIWMFGSIAMYC